MLPDFPSLKNEVHGLLELGMRAEQDAASPFRTLMPKRRIHEGDRLVMVREGVEEEVEIKTYAAEGRLDLGELEGMALGEAYERYRQTAREITADHDADVVRQLKEATERVGNVVEGNPSSPEPLLEIIGKLELGFAPKSLEDLLSRLALLIGEEKDGAWESNARERLREEPYRSRVDRLLEEKREEYRARESRRKLVG
jgi:hypothetical protein